MWAQGTLSLYIVPLAFIFYDSAHRVDSSRNNKDERDSAKDDKPRKKPTVFFSLSFLC